MVVQDENRKIKICNSILWIIKKYIQTECKAREAGGILIGRENAGNTNLVIEFVTEPMPKDKSSRCRFLRKDIGHIEFFKKLYNENEGIYGYIGEWHTHPENIPHYSAIDSNNWKSIGKKMKNRKQYHLIAGIQEIGIWEYNAITKKIVQVDNIKWENVPKNESLY